MKRFLDKETQFGIQLALALPSHPSRTSSLVFGNTGCLEFYHHQTTHITQGNRSFLFMFPLSTNVTKLLLQYPVCLSNIETAPTLCSLDTWTVPTFRHVLYNKLKYYSLLTFSALKLCLHISEVFESAILWVLSTTPPHHPNLTSLSCRDILYFKGWTDSNYYLIYFPPVSQYSSLICTLGTKIKHTVRKIPR